jgi:UDP-N-acetylmuramate dehydrogenase
MKDMPAHIQEQIPLAPRTTLGLGGNARYFAPCRTLEQLRQSLEWARAQDLSVHVLGGGSNMLFADAGCDGLVLHVELGGIEFFDSTATVAAGENWDTFVEQAIDRGLAGVECLSGIPGLVGATPIQNVGAYGQEVKETISEVRALDRHSLDEVRFNNEDCQFAYRHSRFKGPDRDRYIVTQVQYQLRTDGDPQLRYAELERSVHAIKPLAKGAAALRQVREIVLKLRAGKSMLVDPDDANSRSAGSFFVNPIIALEQFEKLRERYKDIPSFAAGDDVKIPAAWLVENAGFAKGYRHGGVGVSQKHALALINCGGTTRELLELATKIQQRVEELFGIRLEREPVWVE